MFQADPPSRKNSAYRRLTLVAFGTSAPEFIVSLLSALKGASDLSIGNIVGSNTFNILFILGVSSLIRALPARSSMIWKEIPFAILAALILWISMNDSFINMEGKEIISRSEGLFFLFFFIIFVIHTIHLALEGQKKEKILKETIGENLKAKYIENLPKAFLIFSLGLVGVIIGGRFVVESSINIARYLGISEALIGLTVAAAGTSLPELAASTVAAYRKETDIAIGNIVGSNIFNILFILGVASQPHGLIASPMLQTDMFMMIAATLLLFLFAFIRKQLGRYSGLLFLLLYAGYLANIILRG